MIGVWRPLFRQWNREQKWQEEEEQDLEKDPVENLGCMEKRKRVW
jgi:hypothetical protein